jgi:non-canonical purine NTP pyrophosphatase (RdgB/HAM1 family)
MENLTYITGNYGKYVSVKEKFEENNITINYFNYDLDEPNINDITYISKEKARQAYEKINSPVFVADCGFYIENYPNNPGYPGAFVKRSGISSDIDLLLEKMKDVTNRNCYFLDCLTFYDGDNYYQFFGKSEGILSYQKKGTNQKRAKSNLWYVFIPKNNTKTLAQMTNYERNNRNDGSTSATDEFINWYKITYQKNKIFTKK